MKKTYQVPKTGICFVGTESLLAGSGVESGKGIGYGGVDDEGAMEPASRRRNDVWTDEEPDDDL